MLFGCFKKKLNGEIKVAQLSGPETQTAVAGHVAEVGEEETPKNIKTYGGLVANFVGRDVLLFWWGSFGWVGSTRITCGKDKKDKILQK